MRYFAGSVNTTEQEAAATKGFAQALDEAEEPALSCGRAVDEAYRVIMAPGQEEALSIRVQRSEDVLTVTTVILGSNEKRTSGISQEGFDRLRIAAERFQFWSRAPHLTASTAPDHYIAVHGAAWIFEGRANGWYHALSRASGAKEREFDAIAKIMFELAGVPIPPEISAVDRAQ